MHPGQKLIETPHIDVLADHLVQVANGQITRLIINMPPRSLKSFSTSVALPAWLLGRDPTKQIISVTGTRELAADFEMATRQLPTTPRCRAIFPHLQPDGRRGDIRLPHGGLRIAATVGGSLIGRGADLIVIDDPTPPAHVYDAARRNAVKKWFDAEVIQRLNDKKTGAVIVVMQRLHVDDLSGHLLGGEQPWVHLNMPAVASEDEVWKLSDGRAFSRTKGEAMAPHIEGIRSRTAGHGALITADRHPEAAGQRTKRDAGRSSPVNCRTPTGRKGPDSELTWSTRPLPSKRRL